MKYEAQKKRMMEEAKAGSGGGKSSGKRKRSKMKSKLMQLNKQKFPNTKGTSKRDRAKND